MALKQAAVTVTDASGTQDLIVPLGTTVTGLLSMLDIDSTDPSLQITGADGRALNLGAVLGTDLPQGVLISITSGRERQIQEQRAIERTSDPWFRPSLVLTICGLLACAMDALLIFCALIAPRFAAKFSLPWWAMLTVGALSLLLCLLMLYQRRVHTNAGLLCAWTLSAGISFLGLLPALGNAGIYAEASQIMTMSQVAALLFPLWGATGVALGLWLWRSTPLSSAHAVSWGLLTGCATVLTFLNAPLHRVAPFAIAFAVCAITASPSLSVRIPATQLLDMPLVTTSAPTVRSPEVPSPSRITGRRVNRRNLAHTLGAVRELGLDLCRCASYLLDGWNSFAPADRVPRVGLRLGDRAGCGSPRAPLGVLARGSSRRRTDFACDTVDLTSFARPGRQCLCCGCSGRAGLCVAHVDSHARRTGPFAFNWAFC